MYSLIFQRIAQLWDEVYSAQDNQNTDNIPSHQSHVEGLINDTQQILTIEDANMAPTFKIPYDSSNSDFLINSCIEKRDHTIKDILCRRRLIKQTQIEAGGTINDLVVSLDVLNDWLAIPIVKSLTSRFAFVRTDFEITMLFTAAPTTSGGLYAFVTNDVTKEFLDSRNRIIEQTMQWPGEQININLVKETKMTIKWISPYIARMTSDTLKRGNNGWFQLRQLVPVSDSVEVVVYINPIKDTLQISYPTNAGDITYESENTVTAEEGTLASSFKSGAARLIDGMAAIGNNLGITPAVNATLKTIAAFGFSKPISDTPVQSVRLMPANQLITNDGVYESHEMGMSNGIAIMREDGIFGSDVDECSFEYITGRPNFRMNFEVKDTDPAGKVLVSTQVSPFYFVPQPSSDNNWMSHQCLIAMQFRHWLASVVFNFTAYATQFHSLKLRFTFIPGYKTDGEDNLSECISTVVHFGNNTTHELIIEPVTNTPFRNSPFNSETYTTEDKIWSTCSLGRLIISIESPLKVTNTVASSSIRVIGTFHLKNPIFHVPADLNIKLINPTASFKTQEKFKEDKINFTDNPIYISKEDLVENGLTFENDIYPNSSTPTQTQSSQMTLISENNHVGVNVDKLVKMVAGERLLNIKQLLKQFVSPKIIAVDEPPAGTKPVFNFNPYQDPRGLSETSDGQDEQDKHDILLSMFTSMRGSWMVMVSHLRDNDPHPTYLANITNNEHFTKQRMWVDYYNTDQSSNSRRTNYFYPQWERNMTFHVPYYCPFNFITDNLFPGVSGTERTKDYQRNFSHTLAIQTPFIHEDDNKMNFAVSRAVADDFQVGYLCPPLYIDFTSYQTWATVNDIEFKPPT